MEMQNTIRHEARRARRRQAMEAGPAVGVNVFYRTVAAGCGGLSRVRTLAPTSRVGGGRRWRPAAKHRVAGQLEPLGVIFVSTG